jgi:DNA-binding beta-propeller fold protein YncE
VPSSYTFLRKWGGLTIDGQLNGPLGVAVDAAGNVYVVDYGNSLLVFGPQP